MEGLGTFKKNHLMGYRIQEPNGRHLLTHRFQMKNLRKQLKEDCKDENNFNYLCR
jgi:hypothetical protein